MTDLLEYREAESALFGIRIASCHVVSVEQVLELARVSAGAEFDLCVIRCPSDRLELARAIEGVGGRLCDMLVTARRAFTSVSSSAVNVEGTLTFTGARHQDVALVERIARSAFAGFGGHWHQDSRLPAALCDELYVRWAGDLVRSQSRSLTVTIAKRAGETIGFLAMSRSTEGVWNVPLTAVSPVARGGGLLKLLIEAGAASVSEQGITLDYETQITNVPAYRTITKMGFLPLSSRYTFHLWSSRCCSHQLTNEISFCAP
jgi:hypothetical protein